MTASVTELFESHGDTVYRRCLQMLRNPAAAADATQEVFMRVMQKRETFAGRSSIGTWMYAIATTYCLQQLRNQRRRGEKHDQIKEASSERHDAPPVPLRVTLQRILDEVDPVTQQIVYLRHIDEMTLEEVADVVMLSRKTVQQRLDAFRHSAQHTLGELGGNP